MVKGEAFLLASLIVVVVIVMMYLPMRKEYLIKQEQMLKKEYEERIFENVLNEIKNVVYISFYDFNSCIGNTYSFLNFSENYVNSKGILFSSLIVLGNFSTNLNLTVLNFLNDDLTIRFVLNDTVAEDVYVKRYGINSTRFSIFGNLNNITIAYGDVNRVAVFTPRSKLLFFVDLKIEKQDYSKRYVDVFVYS